MIGLCLLVSIILRGVTGDLLEIHSKEELKSIKSQSIGLVVLFNAEDAPEELLSDLSEAAKKLREYEIKLATFSCKKVKVEECPHETILRITSNDQYEDLEIKYLQGVDSIIGQVLTFMLTDKVTLVQQGSNWNDIMNEWKGAYDIVFMYIDPRQLKIYRFLMEVAYVFHGKFHFVVSTNRHFEAVQSLPDNSRYALWYYRCKDSSLDLTECPYDRMETEINGIVDILVFLIGHSYPKISYMNENGNTPFDRKAEISIPLKIVYYLTNGNGKEEVSKLAENLSSSLSKLVHAVIIDRNVVPFKVFSRFGFSKEDILPTAVIELRHMDQSGDYYVEQWPLDLDLTLENAKEIVGAIVTDPIKSFRDMAAKYDLDVVEPQAMKEVDDGTLVAHCNDDAICDSFKVNLRRAIRSVYRTSSEDHNFQYVDHSQENSTDHLLPSLRFYTSPDDFVEYDGNFESSDIFKFMAKHIGIENARLLPLSGSDKVPMRIPEEEQSQEGGSDLFVDDEEEDDEGDEVLLQREDDQVSKYMINSRKTRGQFVNKEDVNVITLTDANFKDTIANTDLVLIHFFLPWDPRSFSLGEVYAKVADIVASDSKSAAVKTRMTKLNCFDWDKLCHTQNVTSYPVVKIFRHGEEIRTLQGISSLNTLIKAVKLFQAPIITAVTSVDQAVQFSKGSYPSPAGTFADISVLALLESENSQEFKSVFSVAKALYGNVIFGYTIGAITSKSCEHFHSQEQSVVVFNRADYHRTRATTQNFKVNELKAFIEETSLPTFGELTFENFPLYKSFDKPFVILFTEVGQETRYTETLRNMAKSSIASRVFLTWMDTGLPITNGIMHSLVGKTEGPTIAYLDHGKLQSQQYNPEQFDLSLEDWVLQCLDGTIKQGVDLRDGKWKPLQKGYHFVHSFPPFSRQAASNSEDKHMGNSPFSPSGRFKSLKNMLPSDAEANKHDEL